MTLIAFRNLFQEAGRLIISVSGVAFAIILMFSLYGIYNGALQQDVRFVSENPADLFVSRHGMEDFYHGLPVVALSDLEKLKQEEGVEAVVPMISQRPSVEANGRKYYLFLSSYDPARPEGAPWDVSNAATLADNEIMIPETLSRKIGKKVGDTIIFSESDKEWRIAGLVPKATSFGNHYSWITYEAAKEFVKVPGTVSFAYIKLVDPSRAAELAKSLKDKYPDLNISDKQTRVDSNNEQLDESFGPILKAMVALSVIIGIAVIGLTIYTAVAEKSKEIGVLKAIGLSNQQLYRVILIQSMVTMVLGFLIGIGLAVLLGRYLEVYLHIPFAISSTAVGQVTIFAVLIAALASLLPLRRLMAIDPAEAFRS